SRSHGSTRSGGSMTATYITQVTIAFSIPSEKLPLDNRPGPRLVDASRVAIRSDSPRRPQVAQGRRHTMTTTEQRVLDAYDRGEMGGLANDLGRIQSFTTQETPVAQYLAKYLDQRGLAIELEEVEPGRLQCIARMPGTGGGRSLMLNGHTDIDPLTLGWRRNP